MSDVGFREFCALVREIAMMTTPLTCDIGSHTGIVVQLTTGVVPNVDGSSIRKGLSPKLTTIGSVFRNAGYQTGYFGKWHLGSEDQGRDVFGFSATGRGKDEAVAEQAAAWIRKQRDPW